VPSGFIIAMKIAVSLFLLQLAAAASDVVSSIDYYGTLQNELLESQFYVWMLDHRKIYPS
jgi:hypothetical protein